MRNTDIILTCPGCGHTMYADDNLELSVPVLQALVAPTYRLLAEAMHHISIIEIDDEHPYCIDRSTDDYLIDGMCTLTGCTESDLINQYLYPIALRFVMYVRSHAKLPEAASRWDTWDCSIYEFYELFNDIPVVMFLDAPLLMNRMLPKYEERFKNLLFVHDWPLVEKE